MSREEIQKEALEISLHHKRAGLAISMGVGKTRIAIQHLLKCYNPFIKALVVVPKNQVIESWKKELILMNAESMLDHITFSTYLSLNKQNPADYDILYLDECHSLLVTHISFLSNFSGKILGLTGTPPKNKKSDKWRLVNSYCPIKYTITVDDATDSSILNDYRIFVHELELCKVKTIQKTSRNGNLWWTSELADYEYSTTRCEEARSFKEKQFAAILRMKALMSYETKEKYVQSLSSNLNSKCIIFANTMLQADKLSKYSYHSGNKNSEQNLKLFSDGTINKLSCVLQLSEGISIPDLKQGIIMHAYGNERKTAQRIGRLLRLNPTETAACHILCYKGTQDEVWVKKALETFDSNKIKYHNPLKR
jgi:superfamily II DNA or RNA helicase